MFQAVQIETQPEQQGGPTHLEAQRANGRSPTSAMEPAAHVANNHLGVSATAHFHRCREDINRAR
jgi:hypothetical protein